MLLTHSSGVGYDLEGRLKAWRHARGEPSLAVSGRVLATFSTPLLFEPGEGVAYGGGLDWAGILISRATGQSLGAYMQQHIFAPLGMPRITFRPAGCADVSGALVQMVTRAPDGSLVPFAANDEPVDGGGGGGGGGLHVSVEDYMAPPADLLREEPQVLGREMVGCCSRRSLPRGVLRSRD